MKKQGLSYDGFDLLMCCYRFAFIERSDFAISNYEKTLKVLKRKYKDSFLILLSQYIQFSIDFPRSFGDDEIGLFLNFFHNFTSVLFSPWDYSLQYVEKLCSLLAKAYKLSFLNSPNSDIDFHYEYFDKYIRYELDNAIDYLIKKGDFDG